MAESSGLIETVQHNCDICDAHHAANYTLCTYLMKMRELYRWTHGLPLDANLPREAVGEWVRSREIYWEGLMDEAFLPVRLDDAIFDPFDQEGVNARLLDSGMVYSAGLGQGAAPHFFLAHLHERRSVNGYQVWISGKELARDLISPPAMTRDNQIFMRRESIMRTLWERVQEWRWNRLDNALGRALSAHRLDDDLEQGLASLTDDQMKLALWHEIGEVRAGRRLPRHWHDWLHLLSGTPAELRLRAVRDNLADALQTLPSLLDEDPQLLHLYFALLTPMRKQLQPALMTAYQRWTDGHGEQAIGDLAVRGQTHWLRLLEEVVAEPPPENAGDDLARGIVATIDAGVLNA